MLPPDAAAEDSRVASAATPGGPLPREAPAAAPLPAQAAAPSRALPLWFEPNVGHGASDALFVAGDRRASFMPDGIRLHHGAPVELLLPRPTAPEALDLQRGVTNLIVGAPEDWRTGVPHYGRLLYADVLPGIDVVVYDGGALEFDVVFQPGTRVGDFHLRIAGQNIAM